MSPSRMATAFCRPMRSQIIVVLCGAERIWQTVRGADRRARRRDAGGLAVFIEIRTAYSP